MGRKSDLVRGNSIACTEALTWKRIRLIQGTGRSLQSKGRGPQGETEEISGARCGGRTQLYVSTCLSVHVWAYSLYVQGRVGWQEDRHIQGLKT